MQIEDYLLSRLLQQYLTLNNLYLGQELPWNPASVVIGVVYEKD